MSVQGVNIVVADNGLGQTPPGQGNEMVVIGCSSAGTANVPITSTNPADFITANGYGPGPQLAASIASRTGNPVCFVKAATVSNGSNTTVTKTGTGSSAVTLTGNPNDTYYGLITVTQGGTIGVNGIQFTVSLDAGRSIYQTVSLGTANTYLIPNTGVTVNFGAGTLVTGDTLAWVSTEPLWNDAGISSAMQALWTLPSTFLDIAITGNATGADVSAFDGYMTTLFNKRRFSRMLTNARDAVWGGTSTETEAAWTTSIAADHVNDSTTRVSVSAGHYNLISPVDQVQYRRPLSWFAAVRDSAVAIQVDLGRVADGALPQMVIPTKTSGWPFGAPNANSADGFIYHDESVNPGLDAARFLTAWSLTGLPGFFIKNPNLMAPPGSDFNWLQHGHVIDVACAIWYLYAVNLLSDSVRVNKTTGFILEQDAQAIERAGTARLRDALLAPGAVSDVFATVSRTDNILSTSTITTTVSVIPLGYVKSVNTTITFSNPALQAVGAT